MNSRSPGSRTSTLYLLLPHPAPKTFIITPYTHDRQLQESSRASYATLAAPDNPDSYQSKRQATRWQGIVRPPSSPQTLPRSKQCLQLGEGSRPGSPWSPRLLPGEAFAGSLRAGWGRASGRHPRHLSLAQRKNCKQKPSIITHSRTISCLPSLDDQHVGNFAFAEEDGRATGYPESCDTFRNPTLQPWSFFNSDDRVVQNALEHLSLVARPKTRMRSHDVEQRGTMGLAGVPAHARCVRPDRMDVPT